MTSLALPSEKCSFKILGISEAEERIYRWLLAHEHATAPEAAQALDGTPNKTRRLLDMIESKGLATHSPEHPRRYFPVSPDVVLEGFALHHQEKLNRAREDIRALQEETATSRRKSQPERAVELITNRNAASQAFEYMQRSAQHEVVALMRSPVLISQLDRKPADDAASQREAQTRGVRYRGVVDREYLDLPGAVRFLRDDMEAGQDMRVISKLPFKMIAADHRLAFIPLNLHKAVSPVLLVRSSSLLDALYALFEALWKQAAPLSIAKTEELQSGKPRQQWPEDAENLLWLLATGLNDKRICDEMGLSRTTLHRRITTMSKSLEARTRFQLGWIMGRRSVIDSDE